MSPYRKGFTLIELLIVIAIIGILSTLAIVALGSARQKARDSKRVADLNQISKALELYYTNNNFYPTLITAGQPISDGTTTYLLAVPTNPTPRADGNCENADYSYQGTTNGSAYSIGGCIGGASGSLPAGTVFATSVSGGIAACGSAVIVDRDGYTYRTALIGNQCWLADNLKTLTKPNGTAMTNLADGSERDCISASGNSRGSEADCTNNGALYTWAAAMNGSTAAGTQGICPAGWHLPTDTEQNTLDQYLKDTAATCDAARNGTYDCTTAGTKLKSGGSSGFNAPIMGYRGTNGSSFTAYNTQIYFWSSSEASPSTLVWTRWLGSSLATVGRGYNGKTYSFSVRCVRN